MRIDQIYSNKILKVIRDHPKSSIRLSELGPIIGFQEPYDDEKIERFYTHILNLKNSGLIDSNDNKLGINKNLNDNYLINSSVNYHLTPYGQNYIEEIQKNLLQKVYGKIVEVSGKMTWIFIGAFIAGFGTFLANKLFGICH